MEPSPVQFASSRGASKAQNASLVGDGHMPTLNEQSARQRAIEAGAAYRKQKAVGASPTAGMAGPAGPAI